jgi:hypothetical protein
VRFVVVIATLLAARIASADDALDRARALEARLEYDQALAIVGNLLERGDADPDRYVELRVFAGRLAGGLERSQLAEDHFARALAVRPNLTLPDGTSPKITEPFERAKTRRPQLVVGAHAKQGVVVLEVTDPLGIVAGIAVRVRVDDEETQFVERKALRLTVGARSKIVGVAALDAAGNRVWIGHVAEEVIPPPAIRVVPRARIARWSTWAIVTGVAATGAVLAAWRFDVAQDEWDRRRADGSASFSELEAIEDRGKRWSLVANLGFGIAGAAAIATTIFAVRGSERVYVTPGPGAGVGVAARF